MKDLAPGMIRVTVHFNGRVQGVGFRYTTQNVAANHSVVGYVQNLSDGRVRLVAEGIDNAIEAFVCDVVQTMQANITGHTIHRSPATGEFGQPGSSLLQIRY